MVFRLKAYTRIDRLPLFLLLASAAIALTACGSGSDSGESTRAQDDAYDIAAGVLSTFVAGSGVLANDAGDQLKVRLLTPPGKAVPGSFQLNEDGSFSYQAETGIRLTDQFSYRITGEDEQSSDAAVSLTIYPAPETFEDRYSVEPGKTLSVGSGQGVLSNDQSERALTAELVKGPVAASQFRLNADGSFTYTAGLASTVDSFSYRVSDGLQSSSEETVSIEVGTGEFSGRDDTFTLISGKALVLSGLEGILKNDSGAFGDFTVDMQRLPEHAIDFSLAADGSLVYRTVTETETSDSFSYRVLKNGENHGPYRVALNIQQPGLSQEPPGAFDQCTEYDFRQSASGTLKVPQIANPSFELISQPRLGTLTGFDPASGQFSYSRDSNARGQDSFSYKVFDENQQYLGDASMELIAVPYRIMPVGDSITSGVEFFDPALGRDTPSSDVRVGYRKFLKDSLSAKGYSIDLVGSKSEGQNVSGFSDTQHNGYPGRDDGFVRDGILSWLNAQSADIILLHIGTNNTKSNLNNIVSIFNSIDSWEETNNTHTTVMLAKIIRRTDDGSKADRILVFNDLIEDFVPLRKDAGDRVYQVDQFSALGNGGLLSADKLHPGSEGYRVMSDTWESRLVATGVLKRCD